MLPAAADSRPASSTTTANPTYSANATRKAQSRGRHAPSALPARAPVAAEGAVAVVIAVAPSTDHHLAHHPGMNEASVRVGARLHERDGVGAAVLDPGGQEAGAVPAAGADMLHRRHLFLALFRVLLVGRRARRLLTGSRRREVRGVFLW